MFHYSSVQYTKKSQIEKRSRNSKYGVQTVICLLMHKLCMHIIRFYSFSTAEIFLLVLIKDHGSHYPTMKKILRYRTFLCILQNENPLCNVNVGLCVCTWYWRVKFSLHSFNVFFSESRSEAESNHLSLFFIFTVGNPYNPLVRLQDFLCSLVPVGLAWLRSLHLIMERKLKRKHNHSTIVSASSSSWLLSLIPAPTEEVNLTLVRVCLCLLFNFFAAEIMTRSVFGDPYRIPNGMLPNPQKLSQRKQWSLLRFFIKVDCKRTLNSKIEYRVAHDDLLAGWIYAFIDAEAIIILFHPCFTSVNKLSREKPTIYGILWWLMEFEGCVLTTDVTWCSQVICI